MRIVSLLALLLLFNSAFAQRRGGFVYNGPVNVHSYTRSDGTYVQAYNRSLPGTGTSSLGASSLVGGFANETVSNKNSAGGGPDGVNKRDFGSLPPKRFVHERFFEQVFNPKIQAAYMTGVPKSSVASISNNPCIFASNGFEGICMHVLAVFRNDKEVMKGLEQKRNVFKLSAGLRVRIKEIGVESTTNSTIVRCEAVEPGNEDTPSLFWMNAENLCEIVVIRRELIGKELDDENRKIEQQKAEMLMRLAKRWIAEGDNEIAMRRLKELIKYYPGTSLQKEAEELLQQLLTSEKR